MFPIADHNPHDKFPIVNWTIIASCIGVFLYQLSLPDESIYALYESFGMIPAQLFGGGAQVTQTIKGVAIPSAVQSGPPEFLTLISSMFLHGGWMHLAGNMLYLWIFGDNLEVALGRIKYILFYLACGIAAALAQALSASGSDVPMIGASGAISGVLGGYLLLFPRARIRIFILPLFWLRIMIPAVIVLGLYFAMQVFYAYNTPSNEAGGVAFWAHVGGFVAGMALVPFMKQRDVRLFQRGHFTGPWTR